MNSEESCDKTEVMMLKIQLWFTGINYIWNILKKRKENNFWMVVYLYIINEFPIFPGLEIPVFPLNFPHDCGKLKPRLWDTQKLSNITILLSINSLLYVYVTMFNHNINWISEKSRQETILPLFNKHYSPDSNSHQCMAKFNMSGHSNKSNVWNYTQQLQLVLRRNTITSINHIYKLRYHRKLKHFFKTSMNNPGAGISQTVRLPSVYQPCVHFSWTDVTKWIPPCPRQAMFINILVGPGTTVPSAILGLGLATELQQHYYQAVMFPWL